MTLLGYCTNRGLFLRIWWSPSPSRPASSCIACLRASGHFCIRFFVPLSALIYWLGGVKEDVEQSWVRYSASLISFSIFCFPVPVR